MNCSGKPFVLIGCLLGGALLTPMAARAGRAAPAAGPIRLAQFLNFGQPASTPEPAIEPKVESLEGADAPAKPTTRAPSRSRSKTSRPATATEKPVFAEGAVGAEAPATEAPKQKETKPVVARRARAVPSTAPLPPPRPWGDRDAFTDVEITATTPAPEHGTAGPAPAGVGTLPPPSAKPDAQAAAPTQPPAPPPTPSAARPDVQPKPDQTVVILVRKEIAGPQDLQGRKVALGPTSATADNFRVVMQANAGVTLDPVPLNWTSGLQGLARGEVDGVLLSVGPKMSPEEVTSIALGSYKLLEIPIQKVTN